MLMTSDYKHGEVKSQRDREDCASAERTRLSLVFILFLANSTHVRTNTNGRREKMQERDFSTRNFSGKWFSALDFSFVLELVPIGLIAIFFPKININQGTLKSVLISNLEKIENSEWKIVENCEMFVCFTAQDLKLLGNSVKFSWTERSFRVFARLMENSSIAINVVERSPVIA